VSKENAAALPRCRALPTRILVGQFVQVGGCFRCSSIVGEDIAATGVRRRFEPTWCMAGRRGGVFGEARGSAEGARTMIDGALDGCVAAGQDYDRVSRHLHARGIRAARIGGALVQSPIDVGLIPGSGNATVTGGRRPSATRR
jgi:hypothetical protein